MDKTTISECENEVRQIRSAFNKSLDNHTEANVVIIPALPKSISIGKPARAIEVTYICTSEDETAQLIFGAVCLYFAHVNAHPNDFGSRKLKEISDRFHKITAFVNQYKIYRSKFKIIKDFETYLVDLGLSGSGAVFLLSFIKAAQSLTSLKAEQIITLQSIVRATKLNPLEREQFPLTSWFSQVNWLRAKMAQEGKEKVYLRLASPRLLMQSFNQTIAELMLILQEVSRDLADTLAQNGFNVGMVISTITDKNEQYRRNKLYREILYSVTRNAHVVSEQSLEVLLHDFCCEDRKYYVSKALNNGKNLSIKSYVEKKDVNNFQKATIFDDAFIMQLEKYIKGEQKSFPVSKAEEICFYWLNCAQTVQASDARKLSYSDYIFQGTATKTTHLSCDYWKSRAQGFKRTGTLDTTQPLGKALLIFLQNRKATDKLASLTSNDVDKSPFTEAGVIGRMLTLLSGKTCNQRLKTRLRQQEVGAVFISLINCLFENVDLKMSQWSKHRKAQGYDDASAETYQKLVALWAPINWFTGSMIKTAAVHGTSNDFRVGKLVNDNSHTGKTEHDVYFSEQNVEHKNTAGRLMRFVMEDIENIAFKPNVIELSQKISERQIRTQLITEAEGTVLPFNNLDVHENKEPMDEEGDAITVIDSVETVVNFLHYIEQAKKHFKALAIYNPSYLEKYVLVEAEWREYVLTNLISKQMVIEGNSAYEQYKPLLPDLFLSQIRA
ncbi:hypothetical protein [Paraglaciecola arctica]|uniref:Uncharacterized protein n=1 Tax=Paraglaciecola arctica BSs20135 TaxID=493475 RepID=K6Y4X7_9ALTE|nr:hypothetical protein [Paraglaciecola arctica]GAC19021.1 hypothetical protein GARC_2054 [Paraglaciecola arctica BSs20135]|tara:strand:+ start:197 stop:2371 length:2175 start_codon:yes stop_codon:yes gene_type:complete